MSTQVAGDVHGRSRPALLVAAGVVGTLLCCAVVASAQALRETTELPDPLTMQAVLQFAGSHRQEIVAARARARAAGERPAIVSALDDPMMMPSVNHLPFSLMGVNANLMVEQRFPLSGVLGNRERAAEADASRFNAEAERVTQDVELAAAQSFLMLHERREMARVLAEQVELARQFVASANARYASGTGNQPEVLRAEVEVARLEGTIRVIESEVTAAEAMLNASLGRAPDAAVPTLVSAATIAEPASWATVRDTTLARRAELSAMKAEIQRANAQVSVMDSMYAPMALIRTGPSYMMNSGWGWMATVGVSIPLWRDRLDAGVREAQAMERMAHADLHAMTTMAEGEAATARHLVLAARQRVLALRDDVLPRATQVIEPSVAAYAAGTVPLVSVIDAAQALWSVQAELVSAELQLGLAWARLHRAQGDFEEGSRR